MEESNKEQFFALTPEKILAAVESTGVLCTGRLLQLNSMENRVYELELELSDQEIEKLSSKSERFRIVKFYRPGRWSRAQIQAEHDFLFDLQRDEISVIAPITLKNGESLHVVPDSQIYFALFPKVGGRSPDELSFEQCLWLGRLIARMHLVGARKDESTRMKINHITYGEESLSFLQQQNIIPLECAQPYLQVCSQIIKQIAPLFEGIAIHRIHGDCHFGNILWNDQGPFFLDFDDMLIGPAVQDLWLIAAGRDQETHIQRELILEGYQQIRAFNRKELLLIEPLRFLRMLYFNAWIARRYDDPFFKKTFPQFQSTDYWRSELAGMQEMAVVINNV